PRPSAGRGAARCRPKPRVARPKRWPTRSRRRWATRSSPPTNRSRPRSRVRRAVAPQRRVRLLRPRRPPPRKHLQRRRPAPTRSRTSAATETAVARQSNRQETEQMSKKDSVQKRLQKVRPPRVQLTYDVEKGDAIEQKELPFVVGVMGDFSGQPDQPLP